MSRVINSRTGFTLVEVLIALAILGVFIIPVSGMFVASMRAGETAEVSAQAYSIANRVIELMKPDEISAPCDNEPLTSAAYALYNISSAYEVQKTIRLAENEQMEGFADLEQLSKDGALLTINAAKDGQMLLTNALTSQFTYSPVFAPNKAEITIDFEDGAVKYGNTALALKGFDHVRVIGGDSNVRLILNNKSSGNKKLYAVDTTGGAFILETVAASKGSWTQYDNLSAAESNETGSVATADITVTVRHIATNKEYAVTTKRVIYKYEN